MQRSLQDCYEKLEKIVDKAHNWRWQAGGTKLCDRLFYPSPSDVTNSQSESDNSVPLAQIIEDTSIRDSWIGSTAIGVEAAWKAAGGRKLTQRAATAARDRVQVLTF